MSARQLLLGVDGGQTSTKSMVITVDGQILSRGVGGPSDHFHIEGGLEKNRAALHDAIQSAVAAAGVLATEIVAIGLGLTGAPDAAQQTATVETIVREVLPHLSGDRIAVLADYKTNLLGASGGQPGVVLIAGGGCIAYGITVDGREGIAGGYGFLLGDQGSAFDIGLRAIDAATKSDDRRGPYTGLEPIVCQHFGLTSIRQITRVVYAAGFNRERIALLTPKVVGMADAGDGVARLLLADAAAEAAMTATGVIRQLCQPGEPVDVYLTGGVFKAGPAVRLPFDIALRSAWPSANPVEPRFPPVVGTLIAAARAAGTEPDETWLRCISASLERFPAME